VSNTREADVDSRTKSSVPVTIEDSSLARNKQRAAISSALADRRNGPAHEPRDAALAVPEP
jgi:hypothetical protein